MPAQSQTVGRTTIVDVLKTDFNNPDKALVEVDNSTPNLVADCDVLIAGGGMGGVAAALAILESAHSPVRVCLTEETDWLGGQMTSQAVSAFDENFLVESSGACRSYQELRNDIRRHYQSNYKLSPTGVTQEYFNPGSCWVSRLSFEPQIGVDLINSRLRRFTDQGLLSIFLRHKAISADRQHKTEMPSIKINSVTFIDLENKQKTEIKAKIVIDATELGDLLPLCGLPYTIGSDSKSLTSELHAPPVGDPQNVQDFTFPFVIEFCPGEKHPIAKPDLYDQFNERGKFSFQGYKMFENVKASGRELLAFWEYRRLIDAKNFSDNSYPRDLSMINWDSNDLRMHNIIDQTPEVTVKHLALGKLVSLGFLYWLQNEAPRDDGGKGYPELKLREDMLGTTDGLSKYPYIRESRRAKTETTIVESDIVASDNPNARAKQRKDSVGIGFYPVDIHGQQEVPGAGQETKPFQIPLGALIPVDAVNLLPGCKNIGTTHITNGAYRLHPIEWAIGEAQGLMCLQMLAHKSDPLHILKTENKLHAFQQALVKRGSPLFWFDDIPTSHAHYEAIQFLSVTGILDPKLDRLSFEPDATVSEDEVERAALKLVSKEVNNEPLRTSQTQPATIGFLKNVDVAGHKIFHKIAGPDDAILTREQFCALTYPVVLEQLCRF